MKKNNWQNKHVLLVILFLVFSTAIVLRNRNSVQKISTVTAASDQTQERKQAKYRPGQIIVKFRGTSQKVALKDVNKSFSKEADFSELDQRKLPLSLQEASGRMHFRKLSKIFTNDQKSRSRLNNSSLSASLDNYYVLNFPTDESVEQVMRELSTDPEIELVQPDYEMHSFYTPQDTYFYSKGAWGQNFGDLWGLAKDKLAMESAWDVTQGADANNQSVVVGIVDTGADLTHVDLAQNIWVNPKEIPNNGIDDDHNGYIDDVNGWNFVSATNNVVDDNGHGTHVAGTISAVANSIGVVGVAPKAKVMIVKGLDSQGSGSMSTLASGIVYAAQNGAKVISNSWGCSYGCASNPIAEEAVRTAYALGSVVVFAAGNSNANVENFSPGNMSDHRPIVVGATDYQDKKAIFSNFGYKVDVMAPGVDILSLKAAGGNICTPERTVATNYCVLSGTSMATPHISGLAALILSVHPAYTIEQVRQVMRGGLDDIGDLGVDMLTGWGRANANRSLHLPVPLTAVISSPASNQAFLGTTNPVITITGTAAGPNFKEYQLQYSEGNSTNSWKDVTNRKTVAVQNGTLGTLDINGLAFGSILIRLDVYASDGTRFSDLVAVNHSFSTDNLHVIHNTGQQVFIQPSGRNLFWVNFNPGGSNAVVQYNLDTKEQKIISDTIYSPYRLPAAWGNLVVWSVDWSNDVSYENTFIIKNISDGTVQKIKSASNGTVVALSLYGNTLVYTSKIPGTSNCGVYLYDINSKTTKTLSATAHEVSTVGVFDQTAVWEDYRVSDTQADIYGYDIAGGKEFSIATNAYHEYSPDISGQMVTWIGSRTGDGQNIFLFDLKSKVLKEIPSLPDTKRRITISGSLLAWDDLLLGFGRIFSYNLTSGKTDQVSIDSLNSNDTFPRLSGNILGWMGQNTIEPNDNMPLFDAYYAVLTSTPVSPTFSPTPTPKPGDTNGDGKVDGIDYVAWLANYGKTVTGGSAKGDFDNNGKVDGLDYVIWLIHYGK